MTPKPILQLARIMAIVDGMHDMADSELVDHGYVAMARTVLDHLREPTEQMIAAGREVAHDADVKRCWQAMIDVLKREIKR